MIQEGKHASLSVARLVWPTGRTLDGVPVIQVDESDTEEGSCSATQGSICVKSPVFAVNSYEFQLQIRQFPEKKSDDRSMLFGALRRRAAKHGIKNLRMHKKDRGAPSLLCYDVINRNGVSVNVKCDIDIVHQRASAHYDNNTSGALDALEASASAEAIRARLAQAPTQFIAAISALQMCKEIQSGLSSGRAGSASEPDEELYSDSEHEHEHDREYTPVTIVVYLQLVTPSPGLTGVAVAEAKSDPLRSAAPTPGSGPVAAPIAVAAAVPIMNGGMFVPFSMCTRLYRLLWTFCAMLSCILAPVRDWLALSLLLLTKRRERCMNADAFEQFLRAKGDGQKALRVLSVLETSGDSSRGFNVPKMLQHCTVHVIHAAYGLLRNETGHELRGHLLASETEKRSVSDQADPLYGEVLPAGVSELMDECHLCVMNATTLCDMGTGLNKLPFQVFLQFPRLRHVVGIELLQSRYNEGAEAMANISRYEPLCNTARFESDALGKRVRLRVNACSTYSATVDQRFHWKHEAANERQLELRNQDMFDAGDVVLTSDIVICAIKIPEKLKRRWCIYMTGMKPGARLLTYSNIKRDFNDCGLMCPFSRLPHNGEGDKVKTTWAAEDGHRFFLWVRNPL